MEGTERFDGVTAFALKAVERALEKIADLSGKGREVVAGREGDYKSWDPQVFRVDKEAEEEFVRCVEESGLRAVVLSEELKRAEVGFSSASGETPEVYVVSDPFDGSLLYKRQIPAFWFTSLAVYDAKGTPLCAAVGDCNSFIVDFCDGHKAYTGRIRDSALLDAQELHPSTVTELKDAFLETYLMKPKFLYPCAVQFQPLFSKLKFLLPNGGPAGFADVAAGRVDVYFAYRQPHIEIFSGLAVALRAGAVVTTFDGKPVEFEDNIEASYDVLCSANEELHAKLLEELGGISWR